MDYTAIFGSSDSSETSSDGLCGFPDPLGSPGLRLYGPYDIHGSSDPSETGSDGLCGFPDPLGSPGLLALEVNSGYLSFWFLWFLWLSRMALR
jgi:hypothetical protein